MAEEENQSDRPNNILGELTDPLNDLLDYNNKGVSFSPITMRINKALSTLNHAELKSYSSEQVSSFETVQLSENSILLPKVIDKKRGITSLKESELPVLNTKDQAFETPF